MHTFKIPSYPILSVAVLASLWMLAGRFLIPDLLNQVLATLLPHILISTEDEILKLMHVVWAMENDEVEGPNWPEVLKSTLLEYVDSLPTEDLLLWLEKLPKEMKEELGLYHRRKMEVEKDEEPVVTFANKKRKWNFWLDCHPESDIGKKAAIKGFQQAESSEDMDLDENIAGSGPFDSEGADEGDKEQNNSDYGSDYEESVHEHEKDCFVEEDCMTKRKIQYYWKSANIEERNSDPEFGFLGRI
jgi:hypothetical protein